MRTHTIARSARIVGLDVGEPRRTLYVVPVELPAPLAEPSLPETVPALEPAAVPA
jgi:hypothetical protein